MNKVLSIVLLALSVPILQGQDLDLDSLYKIYSHTNSHNEKIVHLIILDDNGYYDEDREGLKNAWKEAMDKTKKEDYLNQFITHYRYGLTLATDYNEYEEGITYFNKAYDFYQEYDKPQAQVHNEYLNLFPALGTALDYTGKPEKSLKRLLEGLELCNRSGTKDTTLVMRLNYNIGNLHAYRGEYDESEKYFNQVGKLAEATGKKFYEALAKDAVAINEIDRKNYDKAEPILLEVIEDFKAIKKEGFVYTAINNLALVYKGQKKYKLALANLEECKKYHEGNTDKRDLMWVYGDIGKVNFDLGNAKEAIEYCTKALKIAEETNQTVYIQENCNCLYGAHKKVKDSDKALFYLEKLRAVADTLASESKTKEITQLSMQHQFDMEKEKTALAHQAELDKKNLIQKSLMSGLALLGLLLFFVYRNYINKKKANELISKQKKQLEESNFLKDRIFAILGHDLRKPALAFSNLSKKLSYLIKKKDYDTLQLIGNNLEADANSLHGLIDNILNWALSQKNGVPYKPVQFDIHETTTEILNIFVRVAETKAISIENNIPEETIIFADPNVSSAIIRNLVDNALKYTPEGGRIDLNAQETDKGIVIAIRDTGVGMSKDRLNNIFKFRKNKSTKGTVGEKGTGLGLHLVHHLIKTNKGKINVKSQLGKGTTFEVWLPKAA